MESGPPLLSETGWVSHLRGQLELFGFGGFIDRLAERFTVIRHDKPGCGLSEREPDGMCAGGAELARPGVSDSAVTATLANAELPS